MLPAVLSVASLWAMTPVEEDQLYARIDSLYAMSIRAHNEGDYRRSAELVDTLIVLEGQVGETDEVQKLTDYRRYLQQKIDMPVEEVVEVRRHTIVREISATTAQELFSQGTAAYQRGACDSAVILIRHAVDLDTQQLIYPSDLQTAWHNIAACRISQAQTMRRQGKYNEAVNHLNKTKELLSLYAPDLTLAQDKADEALALCMTSEGDYKAAIEIYNRLLQQQADNTAILNNLAVCYARIGDTRRSLNLQQRALQAAPQNSELLTNIATTYFTLGDYDHAREYNEKAALLIRAQKGEQSVEYANALVNIAACLAVTGQTDEALTLNMQALSLQQQQLGEQHPLVATTCNNIADCYYRRLDFDDAVAYLEQAAAIRKLSLGEKHPDYIFTINNIATCYLAVHNLPEYAAYKRQCLDWMKEDVRSNFTWLTEEQRQLYLQQRAPLLAGIVGSNCDPAMQYDKQLLTKGILLSSSVELERLIHSSSDTTLLNLFARMRQTRTMIDEQYALPGEQQDRQTIEALNRQAEQIEYQLLTLSNEYGSICRSMNYRWEDVRDVLLPNEIAVEFAKEGQGDEARYLALLLRKGWQKPKCVALGKHKDFAEYIDLRYRAYEYAALGDAVWHDILQVAGAQQGETIYFAPDGFMYQMGIENLTADSTLMCDAFTMRRLSSTRQLCGKKDKNRQAQPSASGSDITLFGGIYYGENGTRGDRYKYLPATLTEVRNIAALYPNATVFTDTAATKQAFFNLSLHAPSYLHIATHGFYIHADRAVQLAQNNRAAGFLQIGANTEIADNAMSRSGLLLADAESGEGVLTAREIARTDLHGTQLAVLSACQTGMGDIEEDGVAGLQRGLKKAGIETMMISLWDVNDEATQILMTTFHQALQNGKSPQQALLTAQQTVRDFTGTSPQATRAVEEDEAYWQTVENSELTRGRPLKFLRQNKTQNDNKNQEQPKTPKHPYSAPRYWAAFILLD